MAPWFRSKDNEHVWFAQMPEPITAAGVKFQGGDWAMVGEDNQLKRLTEEEYLVVISTMEKCDW